MVTRQEIRKKANQIAERFRPQKIILFGSYAYGDPDEHSDIDLLILMRGQHVHDRALRIRQEIDFDFPVDLIVRSPAEFRRRIAWGDSFLTEIRDKGKVLYEAADARMGAKG